MSLSREEITAAEAMHRFVQQYEIQKKTGWWSSLWLLPSILIMVASSIHSDASSVRYYIIFMGLGVALAVIAERQRAIRYRDAKIILGILEREHIDELPWIRDAIILDAAREIEQEVAKGHAA